MTQRPRRHLVTLCALGAASILATSTAAAQSISEEAMAQQRIEEWLLNFEAMPVEHRRSTIRQLSDRPLRDDRITAAIEATYFAAGQDEPLAKQAIKTLQGLATPRAWQALERIALTAKSDAHRLNVSTELVSAVFDDPEPPLVAVVARLLREAEPKLRKRLQSQFASGLERYIDAIEVFRRSEHPELSRPAEAIVKRLGRFGGSDLPLADLVKLERWKEQWVKGIEKHIESVDNAAKATPRLRKHYSKQARDLRKVATKAKATRAADVGVEVLAEFYLVTRQSKR
ncbi:MAG: hypothetical protein KDC95_18890, partial [Planctomycetes bacterium]|nr:hypothetical protein [Planctomycetota bacterium]